MGQNKHDNVWHSGFVVLNSKDTIKGLVKYNFVENLITVKSNDQQRLLLPSKFKSITFTDTYDSTKHEFHVYYVKTARDYSRPYFFEPIDTSSKIKLVKQYYWREATSNYGGSPFFSNTRSIKYTELYYYKSGNTVRHIRLSKREVLKILKDRKNEIKSFAKEKNLRFNTTRSVLKIFNHYNSLFS